MRIIKYPPPEKEELITCPYCKAELAYTESDTFSMYGVSGMIKYIHCACCEKKIKIDYDPYPNLPKDLEFWY